MCTKRIIGRIPRESMPQIKSSLVSAFIAELTASGIQVLETTLQASELRQSQAELHEGNIVALMQKPEQLRKRLLCSQDGYVLDGHHRWAANHRLGNPQEVFLLGLPATTALRRMAEFAAHHPAECGAKK